MCWHVCDFFNKNGWLGSHTHTSYLNKELVLDEPLPDEESPEWVVAEEVELERLLLGGEFKAFCTRLDPKVKADSEDTLLSSLGLVGDVGARSPLEW